MTEESGENLSKFYDKYDPDSKIFDGRLKLKGILVPFKDDKDVASLLKKVSD